MIKQFLIHKLAQKLAPLEWCIMPAFYRSTIKAKDISLEELRNTSEQLDSRSNGGKGKKYTIGLTQEGEKNC